MPERATIRFPTTIPKFRSTAAPAVNTLALRAVTTVNLGNIDQTSGDAVAVTNFQNVDASALSSGVSIIGSVGANTITGGSGNDTIDGAGGADIINAGRATTPSVFHGTETSIDGGAGYDTLVVATGATLTGGQLRGCGGRGPDRRRRCR